MDNALTWLIINLVDVVFCYVSYTWGVCWLLGVFCLSGYVFGFFVCCLVVFVLYSLVWTREICIKLQNAGFNFAPKYCVLLWSIWAKYKK